MVKAIHKMGCSQCGAKRGHMPGCPSNTKSKMKMSERYAKNVPVKKQLKGMICEHPHRNITVVTNRKGKQFRECEKCGAFLGWLLWNIRSEFTVIHQNF